MPLNLESVIKKSHNSLKTHAVEVVFQDAPMIFEIGKIAKQANTSVLISWGKSVVLVTVCSRKIEREDTDFLPLTCEYIEKSYAAGKIPGGFFKRESRPKESDMIIARIIDRSIRPLFPKFLFNEIQAVATVLSHDNKHETDVMSLCGVSMALCVSTLPFALDSGPIAGVRVVRKNNNFIANPLIKERLNSDIDIFVVSSKNEIVMVEGSADEVSEKELLDAIFFAQRSGQNIILASIEMKNILGKNKIKVIKPRVDEKFFLFIKDKFLLNGLIQVLKLYNKGKRELKIEEIIGLVNIELQEILGGDLTDKEKEITFYLLNIKKQIIRDGIIFNQVRSDGRNLDDIRPLFSEVSILPMAHGSSLFTRGETQALVSVTLGTGEDEQRVENLHFEEKNKFLLHYNFPSFSVGEVRGFRSVSRREIGHGLLAKRAFESLLPKSEEFPYTIRIVSEILESNGSSSMATVCGATLSLFDAGIQLKKSIAGIAMGLVKEGKRVAILSDILGCEDSLGDMDFKVCGTLSGITAFQMDIKINGLSRIVLKKALMQSKKGRIYILNKMKKTLGKPRQNLSSKAPRVIFFNINTKKIKDVIGPGGRIIRDISEKTNARIELNDNGLVQISAENEESVYKAKKIIEDMTKEAKIKQVYRGVVKRVVDYGAFIEIFRGREGLCHISELLEKRVKSVKDILLEGDEVNVVVLGIDREGKVRLSRKRAVGFKPGESIY